MFYCLSKSGLWHFFPIICNTWVLSPHFILKIPSFNNRSISVQFLNYQDKPYQTMNKLDVNLSKLSKILIITSIVILAMYLGRVILIPLALAMFISLFLYPVSAFFERRLPRVLSILLTFLLVISIISGFSLLFGSILYQLFDDIKGFGNNIQELFEKILKRSDNIIFPNGTGLDEIVKEEQDSLFRSGHIIESTILTSTRFIASSVLVVVYTFLFLLYRSSFKKFILFHFQSQKDNASEMLYNIQKVAQNYFYGLLIIILLLGALNGFGLWIIGINYPFLFGYLAAFLAVIPYIGTFIGGLLPVLYALINYDNIWMAVFILLWYVFVQAIEGNILTPKIVGSKVSINPLFALIALITGGMIWGITGMIIFIPFIAMFKVVFDHIEELKPYGLLLSSDFGNNKLPLLRNLREKIQKKVNN